LLNAIEHGNLEISFLDKSEQRGVGKYLELIHKKRSDPRLAKRRVRINYKLDEKGVYYTVRDEGPGFNWRMARTGHDSGEINLSSHGRGLLLAAHYVDKLTFNAKGNEVNIEVYCESYRKEILKCSK
jgi:anti-sigma regulatory factor (Ser/Thr protein kinase)